MYQTILFDLDGTLTDSAEGITNSVAYALKRWEIEVTDKTELHKFVGPPLIDSFQKYYGFSEKEAKEAVAVFQEYYREKGIFENEVYPGISEMLQQLKSRGKKLIVATSKPEVFAVRVMEHFHLDTYFDIVAGALTDETRTKKSEVIQYALERAGITDVSELIMVGDREHDVFGAKAFGMDCIGVLYGYGSREELENAGAAYIVENVADILEICE